MCWNLLNRFFGSESRISSDCGGYRNAVRRGIIWYITLNLKIVFKNVECAAMYIRVVIV